MDTTEYSAATRSHIAQIAAAERREMERDAEYERWEIEQDRKDSWFYGLLLGGFTAYMMLLIWFTQLS